METLSYNQNFQTSLKCPVCSEFLSVPILQCTNGHPFCFTCSKNLVVCPICLCNVREASRNIALQRIIQSIEMNCKFTGCQVVLSLASRQEHMRNCPFNPQSSCIFRDCPWVGISVQQHLINRHKLKVFSMNPSGGARGWNSKSWTEADWGFSIWDFGGTVVLNESKSNKEFFYLWIYHLGQERVCLKLKVKSGDNKVVYMLETASVKTREKSFPFHLSLSEIEKYFLEDTEELEAGYKRLTIFIKVCKIN